MRMKFRAGGVVIASVALVAGSFASTKGQTQSQNTIQNIVDGKHFYEFEYTLAERH